MLLVEAASMQVLCLADDLAGDDDDGLGQLDLGVGLIELRDVDEDGPAGGGPQRAVERELAEVAPSVARRLRLHAVSHGPAAEVGGD